MGWFPHAGLWHLFAIPLVIYVVLGRLRDSYKRRAPPRWNKIPPSRERVLVLGASSGVGRLIALAYAKRGAAVCVVGRRSELLNRVREVCLRENLHAQGHAESDRGETSAEEERLRKDGKWCLAVVADCSDSHDMIRVYEAVDSAWGRLDTVILTVGVSSVLPFMSIANAPRSDNENNTSTSPELQRVYDVALRSLQGNFFGVLLCAAAFIPLLERTSSSPSILLVSSVASLIPAPTRALYAATKSAALLFFQSLSIEHPAIAFSSVLPASIEGDFRASAVDAPVLSSATGNYEGGEGQEGKKEKTEKKLKRDLVVRTCIHAVDYGTRTAWIPSWYRIAHALYWIWPTFIERRARKKYRYSV